MDNVLELVKSKWEKLTAFSKKEAIKEQLWNEIVYHYSAQHRHYHNLNHIAHLFTLCDDFMNRITNPAVVGFAVLYHDIVYDTYRQDNEEQSALFAGVHLKSLLVNNTIIEKVQAFIRATKNHAMVEDVSPADDLALFLDFDMAILSSEEDIYQSYSEKIRQEYAKYPDDIYKEGRKQALKKVLNSAHIFITPLFQETMEAKARENISKEVARL